MESQLAVLVESRTWDDGRQQRAKRISVTVVRPVHRDGLSITRRCGTMSVSSIENCYRKHDSCHKSRQLGRAALLRASTCVAALTLAFAASAHAQELLSINAHPKSIEPTLVCISPDGRVLATNGSIKDRPAGMKLWDAKTGNMLLDVTTWNSRTTEIKRIDLGIYRYRLMLTERWRDELGRFDSLAFAPDGMTLVWGNGDRLSAWDGRTGKINNITSVPSHYLALSPDGRSVASVGLKSSTAAISDTLTGIERARWQAVPSGGMRAVAYSPKGPYLAVIGCEDPRVHVWDLNTRKLRRSFGAADDDFRALAFSFDGKRLAAAGKKVRVWNWFSNQEIGPLDGFENTAQCAAFVPKSAVLIAGSRDGHLRSWDVAAEKQVASKLAHSGEYGSEVIANGKPIIPAGGVTCLTVSNDARYLATAGWDGNVKIWDASQFLPERSTRGKKTKGQK